MTESSEVSPGANLLESRAAWSQRRPLLGAARPAPGQAKPIIDPPGIHNFFMFGSKALYVEHMPMFTEEKHMYQVILRVFLPDAVMRGYHARQGPHRKPWNLVNSAKQVHAPAGQGGDANLFPGRCL